MADSPNIDEVKRTPKWALGLTDKERRFVEEYLVDFNVSRAGRTVGFKAASAAYALKNKWHVSKAIGDALEVLSSVSRASIVDHMAAVAFAPAVSAQVDDPRRMTSDGKTAGSRFVVEPNQKVSALKELAKVAGVASDRVDLVGPSPAGDGGTEKTHYSAVDIAKQILLLLAMAEQERGERKGEDDAKRKEGAGTAVGG